MVVYMHRLARFLDPRNTIEGKIVSVILSVVLMFSMVNLSTIVENASAAGSDGDALFTTELATDDKAKTQTEGGEFSQNQVITDEQSDTNTPDSNQPSQNNNGVATLSLDDDQNGDEPNNTQSAPQKQRAAAPAAQTYSASDDALNKVPVKFFILDPNTKTPTSAADQGADNYYPNNNDNGGVSGKNATTGFTGGSITKKTWEQIANVSTDRKGQIKTVSSKQDLFNQNGFDSSYLTQPTNLGNFNNEEIIWYAIKYQGKYENNKFSDGVHVDGYIANRTVQISYIPNFDNKSEVFNQSAKTGKESTIKSYEETGLPTRPGYKFVGWNTQANGNGVSYAPESKLIPRTLTQLYAQWEKIDNLTYTVKYFKDSVDESTEAGTGNLLGVDQGNGTFQDNIPWTDGKYLPEGYVTPGATSGQTTITATADNNVLNVVYSKNTNLTYTVNYFEQLNDGTLTINPVAESKTVTNQTFENVVTENAIAINGYALIGEQTQQVIISADESQNVINFYYGVDNVSIDPANPGSSDGVPDMYQVPVNFTAVNGAVSFPVTYVTLYDADGNYAIDGTGYLTANQIATATANAGYDQASLTWNIIPSTTTPITSEVTYTATFTATPVVPVVPTPTPVPAGPGAPAVAPGVPTPAAAAAAAPLAAPVATITDDATPLAAGETIDDEDTPLAAFDHVDCWVHWFILVGIILTAIYGAVVVRRRLAVVKDVDDLEDEVLDGAVAGATQSAPADNRQAI